MALGSISLGSAVILHSDVAGPLLLVGAAHVALHHRSLSVAIFISVAQAAQAAQDPFASLPTAAVEREARVSQAVGAGGGRRAAVGGKEAGEDARDAGF